MNKTAAPKLRFPEFQSAPAWETKMLGDICDILNNRRRPISSDNREKGSYPYYGASGIVDYVNDFIFDERLLLVGEDGAKWGAFEKTAFVVEGKYWVNNHAHVLKTIGVNDALLENYLIMLDVSPFVTGAAPPKLTLGKLKEIPIPIPNLVAEQQKIADCLTSLDDLIAAQSQKVETLQAYKKGLMQNLFPAEGESVPRLRFPEFESAGEWKEEKLGNLVDIKSGDSPSKYSLSRRGKYPFLKVEDLNNCEKYQVKSREYSDDAESTIPSKSVIFPKRGAAIQLNKVRINVAEVLMDSNLMAITPNNKIQAEFLYYKIVYDGLFKIADTSTIPQINNKHIIPYDVVIPSIPEQQKIAEVLSALDEQISAQGEALAGLKVHKRGLMQGLFP